MFTNQDIVNRLNIMLKYRGWSVNHLAAEADISQSTINSMFHGKKEYYPSIPTLCKICDALDITMAEFFETVEGIHTSELSSEEYRILKEIQKLSWKQRKSLLEFLETIQPEQGK